MKINEKVKMLENSPWWRKDDIGRIVEISHKGDAECYLICFDATGHQMHNDNGGHTWYASEDEVEKYNPLMKIE